MESLRRGRRLLTRARLPRARLPRARTVPATPPLVLTVGVVLVAASAAFRAWALGGSFFYLDDYNLLLDAAESDLDAAYLLQAYNSHLMPGGRLIAWIVAGTGELNWTLAATLTVALHAAAGLAGLWMLLTLFGARWGVTGLLALFLTTSVTLPATMWWTASLNQVALQVAIFAAVGAWVRYLRGGRLGWLVATLAAVALGLAFYVKALLLVVTLVFIAVGYFASGSLLARVRSVLRDHWVAAVSGLVLVGGYLAYYTTQVEQPLRGEVTVDTTAEIADSMLGVAFVTGVLGGPWRWEAIAPPNAVAAPPDVLVQLSWVAIALVVIYGYLTRERTLRAWLLLLLHLIGVLGLVVSGRAENFGALIGLEYRYLTEVACLVTLVLGLAFMSLRGATESSAPRTSPMLRATVPRPAVALVTAVVCLSGVFSSVRYVENWHTGNASAAYLQNLDRELERYGKVDLADTAAPNEVIAAIFAPDNLVSQLVPLVSDDVRFPEWSPRLGIVTPDGSIRAVAIGPGVVSEEPPRSCGWPISGRRGRSIPLTARAFPWIWWLRIGYLSPSTSPVRVTAGDSVVRAQVEPGVGSLYVQARGGFDTVTIDRLEPGVTICVDVIEVGPAQPGESPL